MLLLNGPLRRIDQNTIDRATTVANECPQARIACDRGNVRHPSHHPPTRLACGARYLKHDPAALGESDYQRVKAQVGCRFELGQSQNQITGGGPRNKSRNLKKRLLLFSSCGWRHLRDGAQLRLKLPLVLIAFEASGDRYDIIRADIPAFYEYTPNRPRCLPHNVMGLLYPRKRLSR